MPPVAPEASWASRLPLADVLQRLGCQREGLSAQEAARRLALHGANRVERLERAGALAQLARQFTQFFSLILWAAAGLALLAEIENPGKGMARVAVAIVAVILASGLFAFIQEHRVENTLEALRNLMPQRIAALRDNRTVEVPIEQLVPGDVLLLGQGDVLPADCRLIEAMALRVNMASLTGESVPLVRDAHALDVPGALHDPLRSANLLLAGSAIVAGQARAVVFATGALTELGRIARLSQTVAPGDSPLQQQLAHLSRVIAVLAMAIGLSMFAIGAAIGVPVWQNLLFAIGIIVAMVPEGLQPTLTLSLVLAAQRMARRQVLIRHLSSVETLGRVSVICTDKTGTLTLNRMQAQEVWLSGHLQPVEALQPADQGAQQAIDLFTVARACHELKPARSPGTTGWLGDPMEVALVELAQRVRPRAPVLDRVDEIAFDAQRMRQSVVVETPQGRVLLCKGALETVLPLCTMLRDAAGDVPLDEPMRAAVVAAQEGMAARGLRVLAFACRGLCAGGVGASSESELVFLGLVGLHDPPRPEVAAALACCRSAGIRVVMVTGDHPLTALALARSVDLVGPDPVCVVTGDQFENMSTDQRESLADQPQLVFARASARHKLRVVEMFKARGQIVAVTGDGVNDAPALKAAHIGIAMGRSGTEVAKQAADVVLVDDNFASIVNGIEEGRAVFTNIRKFLTYVLVHNVAELAPYLVFALARVPLPLTPIQALVIDMGTDSLTALGLGAERPAPGVMRRPPRPPEERLLDRGVAVRAYLFLGLIEAAAALAAYLYVLHQAGWHYGQVLDPLDPLYLRATSACMATIIVLQAVNVFLCRSATRSVVSTGVGGNRWIAWGVLLQVVLLILIHYTAWGNQAIGTAPLAWDVWLFMLPFAIVMLALEELRKAWMRRRLLALERDGPSQQN